MRYLLLITTIHDSGISMFLFVIYIFALWTDMSIHDSTNHDKWIVWICEEGNYLWERNSRSYITKRKIFSSLIILRKRFLYATNWGRHPFIPWKRERHSRIHIANDVMEDILLLNEIEKVILLFHYIWRRLPLIW